MSEKLAEAIIDFANAVEAACVQLKRYVGEVHGVVESASWNPAKIKWVQEEGAKGPYERYPAQDQKGEEGAWSEGGGEEGQALVPNRLHPRRLRGTVEEVRESLADEGG